MMKFCVSLVKNPKRHIMLKHEAFKGDDLERAVDLFKKAHAGCDVPKLEIHSTNPSSKEEWVPELEKIRRAETMPKSQRYMCPVCKQPRTNIVNHLASHGYPKKHPEYPKMRDLMSKVPVNEPEPPRQRVLAVLGGPKDNWQQTVEDCWGFENQGVTERRKCQTVFEWFKSSQVVMDTQFSLEALERVVDVSLGVQGYFHASTKGTKEATKAKKLGIAAEYLEFIRENPKYDPTVDPEAWRTGIWIILRKINYRRKAANTQKRADDIIRSEKELETLVPMKVFARLLKSTHIVTWFERARNVAKGILDLPTKKPAFRELRDVIVGYFVVKCLRRSKEMCQATLGEYRKAIQLVDQKDRKWRIMYLKSHKTMATKSAVLVMTEAQYETMTSYVENYRPLNTTCSSNDCWLFPSVQQRSTFPQKCCEYFETSNVNRILNRLASLSKIPELEGKNLGVRMTRKSGITAFRERTDDPRAIDALAQYASHSKKVQDEVYYKSKQPSRRLETALALEDLWDNVEDIPEEEFQGRATALVDELLGPLVEEMEAEEAAVDDPESTIEEDAVQDPPPATPLSECSVRLEKLSALEEASTSSALEAAPEHAVASTSAAVESAPEHAVASTSAAALESAPVHAPEVMSPLPSVPPTPLTSKNVKALAKIMNENPGAEFATIYALFRADCRRRHKKVLDEWKVKYFICLINSQDQAE